MRKACFVSVFSLCLLSLAVVSHSEDDPQAAPESIDTRLKQLEALAQSAEKKAAASQRDLVRVEEELRKVRDNIAYLSLAQGPVGTIAAFAGPWPPRREDGTTWVESDLGWLPCDGKEIDSQEYPQLYAVLQKTWGEGQKSQTVKIPDLRGQFLRGADDMGRKAANIDPVNGRKVGSPQKFAIQDHQHTIPGLVAAAGSVGVLLPPNQKDRINMFWSSSTHDARQSNVPHKTALLSEINSANVDLETRPVNVAVIWIIRSK